MAEQAPPLAALWWERAPRVAARLSRGLAFSMADGHFLAAAPPVGAWGPPLCAAAGFVAGALTLGYERVFSEALWIVLVAVGVGFFSSGLGLAFTMGFAVGDFLIGQRAWTLTRFGGFVSDGLLPGLVRIRLPMLIGYAILTAAAVYLPRLARALLADLPRADRLSRQLAFGVAALLNLVVVAVGMRLWAEASAVLVRPLFTWQFSQPTPAAVATLQEGAAWVVGGAVAATIARFAFLAWAYSAEARTARVVAAELAVAEGPGITPLAERFGPVASAVGAAAVTTFWLAGVIEAWWVAAVLFGVFVVLRLLREGIIPPRLDGWRDTAARIPVLIRLAVALLVVDTLRRAVVDESDPSFTRLALCLAVAAVVLYLLLPGASQEQTGNVEARA